MDDYQSNITADKESRQTTIQSNVSVLIELNDYMIFNAYILYVKCPKVT
jgi:hypothetical protein